MKQDHEEEGGGGGGKEHITIGHNDFRCSLIIVGNYLIYIRQWYNSSPAKRARVTYEL